MSSTPVNPPEPSAAAELWPALVAEWTRSADYSTLMRLSRKIERLAATSEISARLTPVRLAVVSSATVDFLLPVLRGALAVSGLRPTVHVEPYGQVTSSLLAADGPLTQFRPQVTVMINATPHLPGGPALGTSLAEVHQAVDRVCDAMLAPCATFHDRSGSEIILDTFHAWPWRATGNLGAKLAADPARFVQRVNLALGDRAPRYVHLHDVATLAERRGVRTWFDEGYWYLAKQPLAFDCVGDYCRSLAAVIGAVLGRTRKCLVVDLDNTLWGGVIGDDGLTGIDLGEGSAAGEAFKAFQTYLRDLRSRGVLLAVCSKNDDAVARTPFTDHPEMVLKLDDFVAFKANWSPKSENLRAIAREINLGLDALVFVDDNPAERHEVSRALPEVAVPALPDDPGAFIRTLDDARLFEVTSLTSEDLERTATYQARRHALDARGDATDVDAYLTSLDMRASVRPFEPVSFERITQLVNKTNQFNLTTPRLVLSEIERMAADPSRVTRSVRLRDRFADHGLISVLFGHAAEQTLVLDAWLMSCRVLGRGVEQHLFNHVLAEARRRNLRTILGLYRPTERNGLVRHHYSTLGFTRDGEQDGAEVWRLVVESAHPLKTFMDDEEEPAR